MLESIEKDRLYLVLQTGILQTYMQTLKCETQESFHEMYSGLGSMLHFSMKLFDFFCNNTDNTEELPETVQNVLHEVISAEIKSYTLNSNPILDIEQLGAIKKHIDILEGILLKLKPKKKEVDEPKLVTLI